MTWLVLLLTAYRNLPFPYPMLPSPATDDVPFSHNTISVFAKWDICDTFSQLQLTDNFSKFGFNCEDFQLPLDTA